MTVTDKRSCYDDAWTWRVDVVSAFTMLAFFIGMLLVENAAVSRFCGFMAILSLINGRIARERSRRACACDATPGTTRARLLRSEGVSE